MNSIAYETCKQSVHPYNFVHFLGVWLARRDRRSGDWSGSRNLEKRIRPRALVCRDSKPRVSVPKLVYLVPCCTENLFFPSLSPSSLPIPLPPLLYHAFLLLLYLPIFLVSLILRMFIPFIISLLFLTSSYFYSGPSLFSFVPPYPPLTFSTQSYLSLSHLLPATLLQYLAMVWTTLVQFPAGTWTLH